MEAPGDAVVGREGGCGLRIKQGEGAERGQGGNNPLAPRQGDPARGRTRACVARPEKSLRRKFLPWAIALCMMSCVCSATGGAWGEARPLGAPAAAAPASQVGQRHPMTMEVTAALHLRGGGTHDGRRKKMKRAQEAEEKRRKREAEAEQARIRAKKAKQFEKRKARLERRRAEATAAGDDAVDGVAKDQAGAASSWANVPAEEREKMISVLRDLEEQALDAQGGEGEGAGEGAGGLTDEELLGGIDFERARDMLKRRAFQEQVAVSSEDDEEGGAARKEMSRAERKEMVERDRTSEFRLPDVEDSGDEALELDERLKRERKKNTKGSRHRGLPDMMDAYGVGSEEADGDDMSSGANEVRQLLNNAGRRRGNGEEDDGNERAEEFSEVDEKEMGMGGLVALSSESEEEGGGRGQKGKKKKARKERAREEDCWYDNVEVEMRI